jgi:hypothetical protein
MPPIKSKPVKKNITESSLLKKIQTENDKIKEKSLQIKNYRELLRTLKVKKVPKKAVTNTPKPQAKAKAKAVPKPNPKPKPKKEKTPKKEKSEKSEDFYYSDYEQAKEPKV